MYQIEKQIYNLIKKQYQIDLKVRMDAYVKKIKGFFTQLNDSRNF